MSADKVATTIGGQEADGTPQDNVLVGADGVIRSDRIGIEGAKALEYTVGSDLQAAFTSGTTVGTVIDDPRTGRMLVAYEPLEIVGNPYFVVEAQQARKDRKSVVEGKRVSVRVELGGRGKSKK